MRPAAVPTGFHRTGKLDSAAEQKQFFGQRRLAGIWVRNNGEGSPASHRVVRRTVARGGQCRSHVRFSVVVGTHMSAK